MNVIDIIDYTETCRSCLTNRGDMKSFSDLYSPDISVNEVFCAITSLKCSDDTDGLPTQICNVCYGELNQAYNFILKCRESDKKLRNHLEKMNEVMVENTATNLDTTETNCSDVNVSNITVKSEVENLFIEEILIENDVLNYSESGNKLVGKEIDIVKHEIDIDVKTEMKNTKHLTEPATQSVSAHVSETNVDNLNAINQDLNEEEKPYSCTKCDKSYHTKLNLYYHLSRHVLKNSYFCTICERSYNRSDSLANHMRKHTEKPYLCSVCNKSFSARSSLFDHKRTHTGEKPYLCTMCEKSFRGRFHLEYHLRTHTAEKPFACSTCDKSFRNQSHLKDHLLTHSGERPFSCTVCSKTFTRNPSLTAHMRRHTGEIPYAFIRSNALSGVDS